MLRKFECKDCKARFEADDTKQVVCPKCGSDNVDYAQFRIPTILWKVGGALLAVIAIGIILANVDWNRPESTDSIGAEEKDTAKIEIDTTYVSETGLQLPPVIKVGELTFEKEGYKFNVAVENPPSVKYYIAVVEFRGTQIIAKSEDGEFSSVPFSLSDGGVYDITLFDASQDTVMTSIEKPGFIKQQVVSEKMSVAELQSKVDNRDVSLMGVGENVYLNPEYELKLVGLSADAVNIPSTLGEVFDKLDNEIWESVKVNSLEYDDMNRISKIVLTVKEL